MSLIDKLKGELIDVVQWLEDSSNLIAYRFERYGNEIKNGAKLTVRPGQKAVFINEGQVADIFEPGMYDLTTQNLPILSTLKGWKYGFQSPYKAEVVFINSRIITGFGWGTPSPFRIRDPEFGVLEITARGLFSFKVLDPGKFISNVVGTQGEFTKDEIQDRLRQKFVTEAITAISQTGKSFYEMSASFDALSKDLKQRVELTFHESYGLSIEDTSIQSIDLSATSAAKVEKRDDAMFNDKRIDNYERRARADAMMAAAANPGGGMAASGMGMGLGMAMAGQMAQAMGGTNPGAGAPPPAPPQLLFHVLVNGQQSGPLPMANVAQMIQAGQVTAQSQVWRQGMPAWAPASTVPELNQYFGAVPPPPPPVG